MQPFRLQVLGTKAVNNEAGAQRVKILLSDGAHAVSTLAAGGVSVSALTDNTIVDVTETALSQSAAKKRPSIVLLGLRVVSQWGEKIGDPVTLTIERQAPQAAGGYGAQPAQNTYGAPPVQNA